MSKKSIKIVKDSSQTSRCFFLVSHGKQLTFIDSFDSKVNNFSFNFSLLVITLINKRNVFKY